MTDRPEIDLGRIRTYDLKDRRSKVDLGGSARPWNPGSGFREFIEGLPDELAARDFKAVVDALVQAVKESRPVVLGMGAHVIKVGLSAVVIDLIKKGLISGLALNGAGIIHDYELAVAGHTSEDVEEELKTGTFGMARQTGEDIPEAIKQGVSKGLGIGGAMGRWLLERKPENLDRSILAAAAKAEIPACVFVALGTDIIHMHPALDPASVGLGSHRDFKTFTGLVADLEDGVYLNLGSAVILPEVFLKALTLARNLGHRVDRFTTVNMDFMIQYRPLTNVVRRPTTTGGKGYNLVGHHEIMFPLLAAAWLEGLED